MNEWNKTPLTAAKYAVMLLKSEAGALTQGDLQRQAEYAKRDAARLPEGARPAFLLGVTNICTDFTEINASNGGSPGLVVPIF